MKPKGQTALEYLLIAVVALVVVALVYNYVGTSSEEAQTQGTGITEEVFERMNEDIIGPTCTFTGTPTYTRAILLGATASASSSYSTTTPESAILEGTTVWINDFNSQESRGFPDEWIEVDLGSSVCSDAIRAYTCAISYTGTLSLQVKSGASWSEIAEISGCTGVSSYSFDAREISGIRLEAPGEGDLFLVGFGYLDVRTE